MSMVAVKGMEMPTDCAECMFCNHLKINDYGSYGDCAILGDGERMNLLLHQKHSYCPLVEIVTCKDCRHCFIDEDGCGYHCEKSDTERIPTCADFYCVHAERRK